MSPYQLPFPVAFRTDGIQTLVVLLLTPFELQSMRVCEAVSHEERRVFWRQTMRHLPAELESLVWLEDTQTENGRPAAA